MREMITSLESYNSCIKQQTSIELSFDDKFIQIMEKVQCDHMITKDIILELMQLFYQNNTLFLQLFQTSFLLIFKTYANQGARFNKFESQSIIDKYSEFLKLFLVQMINMELEVKKTTQEEEYFQNFVDFYLAFFAQAITSPKSFIKEFSFSVLATSFKIIDEILDVELLPETQNQLVQSCIYLLRSNFEDYKKMGVQLYGLLRKIKITSTLVQEILFQMIECQQNFTLRKQILIEGITLMTEDKIDRILNRLKDRNPLIIQTVIQKLINEKIRFENLNYEQRIKILIDGIRSYHINVRQKSYEFLCLSFLRFLNSNRVKKLELKQDQSQQSAIQSFLNLFNSDHFYVQKRQSYKHNHVIWSIALESVSLLCFQMSTQLIRVQIKRLFMNMENLSITSNESAFLLSILRQISLEQVQTLNNLDIKKVDLKRFINSADFLPSFPLMIKKLRNELKCGESWSQIQKFGILLKIIQILIQKFDITDCAGKTYVQQQLKKFIIEFDYVEKKTSTNEQNEGFEQEINKVILLERQLRKPNEILSKQQNLHVLRLPVINHPLDLLSQAVQVMLSLSQKQIRDATLQLKIQINELLHGKQLTLQREINTKILLNTCAEIQKAQMRIQEIKPLQHLLGIKTQLQKRLAQNKKKVNRNIIKALTILTRVISFQQRSCEQNKSLIRVSQYIEHIKSYLYSKQDQCIFQKANNNFEVLTFNYLPYVLIYYYCRQSHENFKLFKKLFIYYGLEQDETVLRENPKSMLTKLINFRLLIELQLKYQQQQGNLEEGKQNNKSMSYLVQNLLLMINKHNQKQHLNQLQQTLYQQTLIKVLNSSLVFAKNKTFLTVLISIALKQQFDKQTNHLLIKQFLLVLQQLSTQHSIELFQSIISIYQSLIIYFYQYKQDHIQKQKNIIFLKEITKLFLYLFKITNNKITQNFYNQYQYINTYLIRLIKIINLLNKVFQKTQSINIIKIFRLKHIFPHLFYYKNITELNNKQNFLQSTQINIQLLVFTKRKLQQSLEFFQTKLTLQCNNKKKQHIMFLSDIQQIDQKLQQQIYKRLQDKHNLFDQQSTQHSPNQQTQNLELNNTQKINMNLIQSYEQTLFKEIKQQHHQNINIIKYIEKNKLFQQIILKWKQYHQKQLINIEKIENKNILEQQKTNDNLPQISIQNPKQDLSAIFDRRGRRKDRISSLKIKVQCYQVKASIKKNRYLIIPYEIIEKAELSSRKYKNHQKKLKQAKLTSQKSQNSMIYPKIQNQHVYGQ